MTIVTTKYDENNEAKLKELINNLNPLEKLRLKSLTFGKYTGTGEKEMMKYLVLSKVA